MNNTEIHNLETAAERAKVSRDVILRWIKEGMKATPVGKVGKRGPRDYRIFDSWLVEFIEGRAVRSFVVTPKPPTEKLDFQPKSRVRVMSPLGPCPAPKKQS